MTLAQIKEKLLAAWHSQPMSLVLPVAAFVAFWVSHGHHFSKESLPSWPEWMAGIALLATRFEHITDLIPGFNSDKNKPELPEGK